MKNVIVFDQDPVFLNYINTELEVTFDPATARTISHVRINDDGTLTMLAVVAASRWTEHGCELSIAGSKGRWATKKYLQAVYEYAFTYAKREKIIMVVEPSNLDAVELHERLGHKNEGRLADWYGMDRDALVYGLTKRQYLASKWAPQINKNNEEEQ